MPETTEYQENPAELASKAGEPASSARRAALIKLGMAAGAVYAVPVLTPLDRAMANKRNNCYHCHGVECHGKAPGQGQCPP